MTVAKYDFGATFKQQYSCARCFAEVLPKTANRSSLDIIDRQSNLGKFTVARPVSHKLQVKQLESFVFFTFLTKDANFQQFIVARTVLHKNGKFEDVRMFLTLQANILRIQANILRIFCQDVVVFTFLTKDANFQKFVVARTVLHKNFKSEDICTFLT